MKLPPPAYFLKAGILFAVYFFTARFGLQLDAVSGFATLVWPPTGIALAALLLFGYRLWPAIALGAFLVNAVTGAPPLVAMGISMGNTLEALAGAYMLRRFGFRNSLDRIHDVLGLAGLGALASTMVSATIGVSSLWAGGIVVSSAYRATWTAWWVGDMLGALIVAPLLLAWFGRQRREHFMRARPVSPREIFGALARLGEATALFVVLLWVGALVFAGFSGKGLQSAPLVYFVFLPLIWAALRFGQRGAVAATFVLSVVAIWGTVMGYGPFAREQLSESLLFLQLFMGVVALTAMILASAIAEREAIAEDSISRERRFHAMIEQSADAISLVDERGEVLYASPSAANVLGYQPEELTGRSGLAYVHPEEKELAVGKLAELFENPGKTVVSQIRIKHKNGSWRWVESVARNLLSEPDVRAIVVNYRDVTERLETERAKSEFVSLASHQLRTPASAIKWYLAAIAKQKEGFSEKQQHYLDEVQKSNQRMIALIEALLNVSRIELGTLAVSEKAVNICDIANEVAESFMPQMLARHQVFSMRLDTDLSAVKLDPDLARIIMDNLLSNAITYTPQGGRIDFVVERQGGNILIKVADTGCGIPKEQQPNIFTKLFRADNARAIEPNGTGLGLYITEAIAEKLGGAIRFESEENKGTTFYVTIPIKEA